MNRYLSIPYCGAVGIMDIDSQKVFIHGREFEDGFVNMSEFWGIGCENIPIDVIRAVVIFRISIPGNFYKSIVVKRKTDDLLITRTNTYYYFREPLEIVDGYYIIPYYTRYCIDKEGRLKFIMTGSNLLPSQRNFKNEEKRPDLGRYFTYRVNKDFFDEFYDDVRTNERHQQVGRYRLLALALLPYKDDPFRLDVNHIDGRRENDLLSNLEWCTRAENCQHMYSNGLREDNIHVTCMDYGTNTMTKHHSISSAAKYIGCDDESIRYKLKRPERLNNLYKGRYLFRITSDLKSNPFPKLEDIYLNSGTLKNVVAKNIFTGETFQTLGITDLAIKLRNYTTRPVEPGTVNFNLKRQVEHGRFNRPYRGFMFKYEHQDWEFPVMSDYEIDYWRKVEEECSKSSSYGLILFKDGKYYRPYSSGERICEDMGLSIDRLKKVVFINKGIMTFEKDGSVYQLFRLYEDVYGLEVSTTAKEMFGY